MTTWNTSSHWGPRMSKALVYELGKSISFGRLSLLGKVLWPMLLAASDNQGRGIADADVVKWTVCANVQELTVDNIPGVLAEMEAQGMICLYKDARNRLLYQIVHWWEYQQMQWAQPSRYEPPEGWVDRVRFTRKGEGTASKNWDSPGGFVALRQPDDETEELPDEPEPPPDEPEPSTDEGLDNPPGTSTPMTNLTQPNSTEPNPTQSADAQQPPAAVCVDNETREWIEEMENTTPPVRDPPHSAEEYVERVKQAEAGWLARASEEPWQLWGEESDVIRKYAQQDIPLAAIKQIGYALEQCGLKPVWEDKTEVKKWLHGIQKLYRTADGNAKRVAAVVAQTIRENNAKPKQDRLTLTSPHSFCFAIRQANTSIAVPSKGTDAPDLRAQMKADLQYQTFKRLREQREHAEQQT